MPSYRQGTVETVAAASRCSQRPMRHCARSRTRCGSENVGALVVGDEQRPLGIISERDVVSRIGQGDDLDALTAEQVMTSHLVAARVGDTLDDAAYQMLESAIRHLPLIDHEGRVVGMISVRDLLRPLLVGRAGVPSESDRDR